MAGFDYTNYSDICDDVYWGSYAQLGNWSSTGAVTGAFVCAAAKIIIDGQVRRVQSNIVDRYNLVSTLFGFKKPIIESPFMDINLVKIAAEGAFAGAFIGTALFVREVVSKMLLCA